jgi:hypothetical protein
MSPVNTYDPKVHELAEHFLADDDVRDLTPPQVAARTHGLAIAIQTAIEEWIEDEAETMRRSGGR